LSDGDRHGLKASGFPPLFHSQPEDQKYEETRHHSLFATSQIEHAGQDKSNPMGRKARCGEKFNRQG